MAQTKQLYMDELEKFMDKSYETYKAELLEQARLQREEWERLEVASLEHEPIKLTIGDYTAFYLIKPETKGNTGCQHLCALKNESAKVCDTLGEQITQQYPDLQSAHLAGCKLTDHILIEDEPMAILEYLVRLDKIENYVGYVEDMEEEDFE